jgi:hypothetical protein
VFIGTPLLSAHFDLLAQQQVSAVMPDYLFARKSQLHAITGMVRSSHTDRGLRDPV